MKTTVKAFQNMSEVSHATLKSAIRHEREAFGYGGHGGYGEHRICKDSDCRRVLSIDDVYPGASDTRKGYKPLAELEADGPKECDCPDCGSPTILIFDPKIIKPHLVALYRDAFGTILEDENGEVRGSCVIQQTSLRESFDNINYREGFKWEEFRDRTSEVLGVDAQDDLPVLNADRVSIERPFRDGGTLFELCGGLNEIIGPEFDETPVFSCTRYDGKILPILQGSAGYKQIVEDKYGTVIIGTKRFGDLRRAFTMPLDQFAQNFGMGIMEAHQTIRDKINPHPGPKYYPGIALFDDIVKDAERIEKEAPEAYNKAEISPELVYEVSTKFRELYCNAYEQYVFYPSEAKAISPKQIFKTEDYVPLEQLDSLDLDEHKHPETGEVPAFWHDPEVVKERLNHLIQEGQIALSRNAETSEIEAFTYGYRSSTKEAFEREEWRNPINYSGLENPEQVRDFSLFLEAINRIVAENPETFEETDALSKDSSVYVWNQFGVMPSGRGKGKMKEVAGKLAKLLEKNGDLHGIGLLETQSGSLAHKIFQKAGALDVPGALDKSFAEEEVEIMLMVFSLKNFASYFSK